MWNDTFGVVKKKPPAKQVQAAGAQFKAAAWAAADALPAEEDLSEELLAVVAPPVAAAAASAAAAPASPVQLPLPPPVAAAAASAVGCEGGSTAMHHEFNHVAGALFASKGVEWVQEKPKTEVVRQQHLLHDLLLRDYSRHYFALDFQRGPVYYRDGDATLSDEAVLKVATALQDVARGDAFIHVKDYFYWVEHHVLEKEYHYRAVRRALAGGYITRRYQELRANEALDMQVKQQPLPSREQVAAQEEVEEWKGQEEGEVAL